MIVFEQFSLFRFLLILDRIKAEGTIYLIDKVLQDTPPDTAAIAARCRRFVPGLEVKLLSHYDHVDAYWQTHLESPAVADALGESLWDGPAVGLVRRLYGSRGTLKAFKNQAEYFIRDTVYFRRVLKTQAERCEGPVVAVPVGDDFWGLLKGDPAITVPRRIRLVAAAQRGVNLVRSLARFAGIALHGLTRSRRLGAPKTRRLAAQIVWPQVPLPATGEGETFVRGIRTTSFYLADQETFPIRDTVFCLHLWRRDAETEKGLADYIGSQGGDFCVVPDLPPSHKHAIWRQLVQVGLGSVPTLLRCIAGGPRQWWGLEAAGRMVFHLMLWEVFCLHYRPRVMVSQDDQNITHIARTLVFERHGLRNAGIHHPAESGLVAAPEIAFVHFHLHLRHGHMQRAVFSPYWDDTPGRVVGPPRADFIRASTEDPRGRAAFARKYGKWTTILIAPPGPGRINHPDRVLEFYRALEAIVAERPDVHLIFRFRRAAVFPPPIREAVDRLIEGGRATVEPRGFLEPEPFDTYDLIAYSDLVVSNVSSIMQEAFAAGEYKVICYAATCIDNLYVYSQLNPLLVACDGETLKDRIRLFLDGPHPVDNIEEIRRQSGAVLPYDGRNIARIREALWDIAEEADAEALRGVAQ